MFKALGNLTKAVVSVALTPVTLIADTVMFIPDASSSNPDAFSRTGRMLKNAGDCTKAALKPDGDE